MPKSILPVTNSSNASYSAPSFSRWGIREVAVILGLSVVGLLLIALYRRSRSEPSSDSTKPITPTTRGFVDLDRRFSTDKQHSSQLTHKGRLCINETGGLPFNKFAEGFIRIQIPALFNCDTISGTAVITVRCWYKGQSFFVLQDRITHHSTIEFFLPNMPFKETMSLHITLDNNDSKTVSLSVDKARGIYDIEGSDSLTFTAWPDQTKSREYHLNPTKSIKDDSSFSIDITKDQQLKMSEPKSLDRIFIHNQSARAVAYLKLVSVNANLDQDFAIALPFHFNPGEVKTFLPSELIDHVRHAYLQSMEVDAPIDLKLELTEILVTTYIREETF